MRRTIQHPARLVPLAFLVTIAVGTLLLALPLSHAGDGRAPLLTALFTSTSAVCVTGLIVVDTPTYWSVFGQTVIMALFQVGGFGIMTGASLLGLLVTRRLRLRNRLVAQAETRTLSLGDITRVLKMTLLVTVSVELAVTAALTLRMHAAYEATWPGALWHGGFHAVSAFNNAGFSTYSDNLTGFVADPAIIVPIMVAIVIGGIGIPVLYDLSRERRPSRWSIHTKLTVGGTVILLLGGMAAFLVFESANPGTVGPLDVNGKVLASLFHSVTSRTAGFNSVDVAELRQETLGVTYVLMFIGGGSAGTAGGIKVATFLLLAYVIWAEIRGEPDTIVFRRRITLDAQRQALSVALLGVAAVALATLVVLSATDFALSDVLFECVSAFATVGLSTGLTPDLPAPAQVVLIIVMYVGRVGTITVATALALRTRHRLYRLPEERPIVG
ncbi:potassium transporter TrkG [Actinopolymorpha sp. B11F2]|uniref:TrkH family potassium uptake protein n=1 Tax=Actinopolymorpha sp. B11F2 TaxID=3160862 RepID=UPI0032E3B909